MWQYSSYYVNLMMINLEKSVIIVDEIICPKVTFTLTSKVEIFDFYKIQSRYK